MSKVVVSPLHQPTLVVGHQGDWLQIPARVVPVWDKVPLEPYASPKSVIYYSLAPPSLRARATAYLRDLSAIYTACNLGQHVPGSLPRSLTVALGHPLAVPWPIDPDKAVVDDKSRMSVKSDKPRPVRSAAPCPSSRVDRSWYQALGSVCKELKDQLLREPPSSPQLEARLDEPQDPCVVVYVFPPSTCPADTMQSLLDVSKHLQPLSEQSRCKLYGDVVAAAGSAGRAEQPWGNAGEFATQEVPSGAARSSRKQSQEGLTIDTKTENRDVSVMAEVKVAPAYKDRYGSALSSSYVVKVGSLLPVPPGGRPLVKPLEVVVEVITPQALQDITGGCARATAVSVYNKIRRRHQSDHSSSSWFGGGTERHVPQPLHLGEQPAPWGTSSPHGSQGTHVTHAPPLLYEPAIALSGETGISQATSAQGPSPPAAGHPPAPSPKVISPALSPLSPFPPDLLANPQARNASSNRTLHCCYTWQPIASESNSPKGRGPMCGVVAMSWTDNRGELLNSKVLKVCADKDGAQFEKTCAGDQVPCSVQVSKRHKPAVHIAQNDQGGGMAGKVQQYDGGVYASDGGWSVSGHEREREIRLMKQAGNDLHLQLAGESGVMRKKLRTLVQKEMLKHVGGADYAARFMGSKQKCSDPATRSEGAGRDWLPAAVAGGQVDEPMGEVNDGNSTGGASPSKLTGFITKHERSKGDADCCAAQSRVPQAGGSSGGKHPGRQISSLLVKSVCKAVLMESLRLHGYLTSCYPRNGPILKRMVITCLGTPEGEECRMWREVLSLVKVPATEEVPDGQQTSSTAANADLLGSPDTQACKASLAAGKDSAPAVGCHAGSLARGCLHELGNAYGTASCRHSLGLLAHPCLAAINVVCLTPEEPAALPFAKTYKWRQLIQPGLTCGKSCIMCARILSSEGPRVGETPLAKNRCWQTGKCSTPGDCALHPSVGSTGIVSPHRGATLCFSTPSNPGRSLRSPCSTNFLQLLHIHLMATWESPLAKGEHSSDTSGKEGNRMEMQGQNMASADTEGPSTDPSGTGFLSCTTQCPPVLEPSGPQEGPGPPPSTAWSPTGPLPPYHMGTPDAEAHQDSQRTTRKRGHGILNTTADRDLAPGAKRHCMNGVCHKASVDSTLTVFDRADTPGYTPISIDQAPHHPTPDGCALDVQQQSIQAGRATQGPCKTSQVEHHQVKTTHLQDVVSNGTSHEGISVAQGLPARVTPEGIGVGSVSEDNSCSLALTQIASELYGLSTLGRALHLMAGDPLQGHSSRSRSGPRAMEKGTNMWHVGMQDSTTRPDARRGMQPGSHGWLGSCIGRPVSSLQVASRQGQLPLHCGLAVNLLALAHGAASSLQRQLPDDC